MKFPPLADNEIVLYGAPGSLSRAAELLAEHIMHSLEIASGQGAAELVVAPKRGDERPADGQ